MISKYWISCFAILAVGCATPVNAVSRISATPAKVGSAHLTHPSFLDDFISAVNAKDAAALEKIFADHFTSTVPAKTRIERMMDLADQGGPFKIDGEGPDQPGVITLTGTDREGTKVAFAFQMSPDGKVDHLRAGPSDAVSAKPAKDYSAYTDLAQLAHDVRTDNDCPAIGIAILDHGKSTVVVDGVREIGKPEAVTADEPWSVGSIGKPICSTLIGLLIDAGKLRFDETLGEALPDLAKDTPYAGVTLEQIMRHRGGIPQDLGMRKPQVEAIMKDAKSPAELRLNYVKDILSRAPIGKPGEQMKYSNAGYALLSEVVERASGLPYETAMRTLLFAPLGLKHSYIGDTTWPAERPMGHVDGPKGLTATEMTGPMESFFAGAGGGIDMSLGDLALFGQAHLVGLKGTDGFLKAETVKHLHSIPEGQSGEPYACGWGVGMEAGMAPGVPIFHGHNGSNGTFRAQLAVFPDLDLVVVSIVNRGGESEPAPGLQAVVAVAKKLTGLH